VDDLNVGVCTKLRQDAGIDLRGDAVVDSLHSVKRPGALTEVAEMREHTLLCSPDSHHLCARGALSSGALLRIGGAIAPIAQSVSIDF
jgi:hypothetical protein